MAKAKRRGSKKLPFAESELHQAPVGGWLVCLLLIAVLASSIAVIQSSHKGRRMFSELQSLHKETMSLEEEWERLLLEQSTWASPDRVQQLALKKLKMHAPNMREVTMVRGYGKAQ